MISKESSFATLVIISPSFLLCPIWSIHGEVTPLTYQLLSGVNQVGIGNRKHLISRLSILSLVPCLIMSKCKARACSWSWKFLNRNLTIPLCIKGHDMATAMAQRSGLISTQKSHEKSPSFLPNHGFRRVHNLKPSPSPHPNRTWPML